MALQTVITPPQHLARLSGVKVIALGARSVYVQCDITAYRMPRRFLPPVLPEDFMALAELARKAAREHGTECDPRYPEQVVDKDPAP